MKMRDIHYVRKCSYARGMYQLLYLLQNVCKLYSFSRVDGYKYKTKEFARRTIPIEKITVCLKQY